MLGVIMSSMMGSAKYYGEWGLSFLFGYGVPWWVYVVLGTAGCIALIVLVPNRLGIVLGVLVLTLGGDIGFYSLGNDNGIHLERQTWQRLMAAEVERLQEESETALAEEKLRTAAAEGASQELRGKVDELAGKIPTGGDIVVPESVARQLLAWRGRHSRSGAHKAH